MEKERDNRTIFEMNFKKLEDELAKMKKELPQRDDSLFVASKREISTQTDGIDDKKKSDDLEKQELQLVIKEQQIRIKELTQRALSLSQELEEAHQARQIANEISQAGRQTMKTILSESSSTDEIIQDAKKRLKRLKEETFKADQSYFNSIVTLPLS